MISHLHLVGSGVLDYGTVGVFPVNKDFNYVGDVLYVDEYPWMAPFSHDKENITVGL